MARASGPTGPCGGCRGLIPIALGRPVDVVGKWEVVCGSLVGECSVLSTLTLVRLLARPAALSISRRVASPGCRSSI